MKKTLLILAAVLCFTAIASAQPKAIGLRIGSPRLSASYEHYVNSEDFLEFEVGYTSHRTKVAVDGVYNFVIAQPDWAWTGSCAFYAGPGVGIRVADKFNDNGFYAGVVGNIGFEYTFDFPLQLSWDIRPKILIGNGGICGDYVLSYGVSIRYAF